MKEFRLSIFAVLIFFFSICFPFPLAAQGIQGAALLEGLKVFADDPLRLAFIMDTGDDFSEEQIRKQADLLIRYFLAGLTIPGKDLWVNLSPYEQDRIIPEVFGRTRPGLDLLEQDRLLKQMTASLLDPESKTGKIFWSKVYALVRESYGTTDIAIDTFNKIWVVPGTVRIYEDPQAGFVYIKAARMKVMLEADYREEDTPEAGAADIARDVLREIVVPLLEEEINTGRNFFRLRQVYQSLALAAWYKRQITDSLIAAAYVNRRKISGLSSGSHANPVDIWTAYVNAFKKGVFDVIAQDSFDGSEELPRRYFSGGFSFDNIEAHISSDGAMPADEMAGRAGLRVIDTFLGAVRVSEQEERLERQEQEETRALEEETDAILLPLFLPSGERAFRQYGILPHSVAAELLYNAAFSTDDYYVCEKAIHQFVRIAHLDDAAHQRMMDALESVLKFSREPTSRAAELVRNLGRLQALYFVRALRADPRVEQDNFPAGSRVEGLYLDLASGPNFAGYMPSFAKDRTYMAVDNSPYVASYLEELRRRLGLENIIIRQENVLVMPKPERPVATIRMKNVWHYVEGFSGKFPEMADWVVEGGQIIVMSEHKEGQTARARDFMKQFVPDMIDNGWNFHYQFADPGSGRMDRMVLSKRHRNEPVNTMSWSGYLDDFSKAFFFSYRATGAAGFTKGGVDFDMDRISMDSGRENSGPRFRPDARRLTQIIQAPGLAPVSVRISLFEHLDHFLNGL